MIYVFVAFLTRVPFLQKKKIFFQVWVRIFESIPLLALFTIIVVCNNILFSARQ